MNPMGSPPPPGYNPPPPGYNPPPPGYGPPGTPPGPYRPSWAPSPAPAKMGSSHILLIFLGALIGLAVIGGLLMFLNAPAPPVAPCPPNQPCAPVPTLPPVAASSPGPIKTLPPAGTPGPGASLPVPPPGGNSPVALSDTLYTDSSLNYGFEYDPDTFELANHTDGSAVLNGTFFDAQIWIDAKTADTSPQQMIQSELADVDKFLIARVADSDTYDALLGPSVGFVPGAGGVWSGTLTGKDGSPVAPGGVTIVSATDGRITVAVVVIVGTPDARQGGETQQHAVRSAADEMLKTFNWNVQ